MPRTVLVVGALALCGVLASCRTSSSEAAAGICRDLGNLQATVALLTSPPRDATVGDIRGGLQKLDGTWQAVHDDPQVPDDEDEALLRSKEDYLDAIGNVGDDDAFAPYVPATRGIAEGLDRAYEAVRLRLACPPPSPT